MFLGLIGTPLMVTDYERLAHLCLGWGELDGVTAVEFANTQIVTMRRHDPSFRELTSRYDCFIPDGMPLIWCLNRQGAGLEDRVYGPTLMRRFLTDVPDKFTHYLLGGSEECGRRLRDRVAEWNPGARFVGAYHGLCSGEGCLEGGDDARIIEEINRLSPDFIWVGFGTPKQQAWLHRHKDELKRGVVLTVGFAFDVNAGMKPDAPMWMQNLGLTWLFRMGSEPGRLVSRYFKYNTLFIGYLVWDFLRGRAGSRGS
jgi:N-acetylglucosaminyldiphosphoundecaprenol N-acetyl-beta-D-mannosaminyltransferase